MRRYHITLGAKTTANGTVITASSMCSIDGVRMALEGDKVSCPACGSEGIIVCDGPRLSEKWNGKQAALHDDLCACKCVPPPRMVAIQKTKSQIVDGERDDPHAGRDAAQGAAQQTAPSDEKVPLRLIEEATNQPHRSRAYRLELAGGRVLSGVTDADGLTQPLSAAERSAVVAWHVLPAAPAV